VPELPDVDLYVEALAARVRGDPLVRVDVKTPFLLRTADPPLRDAFGRRVEEVRRQGKRIVLALDGGLFLAIHLMIAGRLHFRDAGSGAASSGRAPGAKAGRGGTLLAAFEFPKGSLTLTEAGTTRRAALHVVRADGLAALDRGGLEPLDATPAAFRAALVRENHTLKRALTDPRIFAGIGNAFSDEILHAARLSPVALTSRLAEEEVARLHAAVREVLGGWRDRLRAEAAGGFPEGVTAFRPGFAVHGRHRAPCPACGTAVQRIVYASNETNYCPRCQTGGKILSDRSLARLLGDDWPRTVDELERNPALGARPAPPAGAPQRRRSPA
jgi:formamidopyrimidine-DNA glycosylase